MKCYSISLLQVKIQAQTLQWHTSTLPVETSKGADHPILLFLFIPPKGSPRPEPFPVRFLLLLLTNDYRQSGFQQHKWILLRSGGQKSKMSLLGLKSRYWQGCSFSGGSRRESVFLTFPGSRGRPQSLACGPSLCLQSQQWNIFKSVSDLLPSALTFSDSLWP